MTPRSRKPVMLLGALLGLREVDEEDAVDSSVSPTQTTSRSDGEFGESAPESLTSPFR